MLVRPFGLSEAVPAGALGLARAGGDRRDLRGERPPESRRCRGAFRRPCRRSPTIPAWRSKRSAARPASTPPAGRDRNAISPRRCDASRSGSPLSAPPRPSSAGHASSRSCRSPSPTEAARSFRGEVAGTLILPPRGDERLRLRSDLRARRPRRAPSARCAPRREARACRTAPAPSRSSPAPG